MDSTISFRQGEVADLPLLWQMLFEAAAAEPEIRKMGREIALSLPRIRKYVEGWGREGDLAVVASEASGRPLGAAWFRLFPAEDSGYGFVGEDIPEVTIGVIEDARRRGIGGQLLEKIIEMARSEGYRALSLSVESESPAVKLYEKHGFIRQGPSEQRPTSFTMLLELA